MVKRIYWSREDVERELQDEKLDREEMRLRIENLEYAQTHPEILDHILENGNQRE